MDGRFWELGEMILLILKLVRNLPFSLYWEGRVGSFNLHQQRTIIQDPSTAYQLGRSFCKSVPCGTLPAFAELSPPWSLSPMNPVHSTPSPQQGFWLGRPVLAALGDSGKSGLAVYTALSAKTSVRAPKDVENASFILCRGSPL